MRIATWNVNSVRSRMPRLLSWLDERRPDVVCLQETKLDGGAFEELLGDELRRRGYAAVSHGQGQWNGVAILSRVGLDDVVAGLDAEPARPSPEARAIAATCGGLRVHSVYVPNGRTPGSDHYHHKLRWLAALRDEAARGPAATVVCGDMNVAPAREDVFDPDAFAGQTHVTPPERAALAELMSLGLRDVAGRGSASSPTGTIARACSTGTWACASTSCSHPARSPPAFGPHGWTGRPARGAGRATTPR
jgi:exodeoxyribonuclease III